MKCTNQFLSIALVVFMLVSCSKENDVAKSDEQAAILNGANMRVAQTNNPPTIVCPLPQGMTVTTFGQSMMWTYSGALEVGGYVTNAPMNSVVYIRYQIQSGFMWSAPVQAYCTTITTGSSSIYYGIHGLYPQQQVRYSMLVFIPGCVTPFSGGLQGVHNI